MSLKIKYTSSRKLLYNADKTHIYICYIYICTQNTATKYKLSSFVTILKNKPFILIVDCLIH